MRILGFLKYIKPYRMFALNKMLDNVEGYIYEGRTGSAFLCYQFWGGNNWFLPDWKGFPEIKKYASLENPLINNHTTLDCNGVWFDGNEERRDFLKQCINDSGMEIRVLTFLR